MLEVLGFIGVIVLFVVIRGAIRNSNNPSKRWKDWVKGKLEEQEPADGSGAAPNLDRPDQPSVPDPRA